MSLSHPTMFSAETNLPAELLRYITPDETAAQFLVRQAVEAVPTGLPFIDAHVTLRPGIILELVGPAAAAKSEILTQVAVNVLCSSGAGASAAPDSSSGIDAEHVVVVDCAGSFDLLRLIQVLKARAEAGNVQLDLNHVLQHLHFVRCFSSLQLLIAIATLPAQLSSMQGRCKMLLLDNIGAFLWQDRAAAGPGLSSSHQQHHQQQQPPFRQPGTGLDASRVQGALAALLRGLSHQLRCPIIVAKQAGVAKLEQHGSFRLQQKEVLTPEWQSAVSSRLLLLPVVAAGQALQVLAGSPQGTQLLLQWQAAGRQGDARTGPVEQHVVLQSGGLARSAV